MAALEVAKVNLPVGILIWVMIIPMLLKIDFGALGQVKSHVRGIGVTLFINWAVKPFSMALLAWIFIRHVFAPYLPAGQIDSYIAGLILLAPRLHGHGCVVAAARGQYSRCRSRAERLDHVRLRTSWRCDRAFVQHGDGDTS